MNVQTNSLLETIGTLPANSTLLLHEVSWVEYEALLALLPDTPRFRLSYDQGTLEIITLSPRHERLKSLFTPLLTVLTEELNLNLVGLGSTTFRRVEAVRGLEPDDYYYIHQAERMAGQDIIDLATDPPPDLVVEVDITHPSLDKFPIHASLGVPEVWRHDGDTLQVFRLRGEQYTLTPDSGVFPWLPAEVLARFVQQGNEHGIIPWCAPSATGCAHIDSRSR
jgi:Uma2 family endonuclease